MASKDTLFIVTSKGKKFGDQEGNEVAQLGYDYRMTEDYDLNPQTIRAEFLYTAQNPGTKEDIINSYFAQETGNIPKSMLTKEFDFLVKEGYIIPITS